MRDVYHCTPNELEQQPLAILDLHRQFISMEEKQRKLEENRAKQLSKSKPPQ